MCDSFRSTGQRHGPRRRGRVPRTATARRRGLTAARGAVAVPQGLGTRRCAALAAFEDPEDRRRRAPLGRELRRQARPGERGGVMDRNGETGREGAHQVRLVGAAREPLLHQRGELRAFGGGQRHRRRLPPQSREQDHRPGTRRSPGTLLGDVTTPVRRPPGVVPGRTRPPRPGDPSRAPGMGQVLPSAPQMTRGLDAVEGGPQRALSVGKHLGQRLHGDVGPVREPVDVRGDGGLARWQVREVRGGAGRLARCGALSVAGADHRVRSGVRGQGGSTKLAVSHPDRLFDLGGQAPAGVGAPDGGCSFSGHARGGS